MHAVKDRTRCAVRKVDFGNVVFPADVQVPRPTVIGQFADEENGVSSGNVTVHDVNNINVDAFTCSCSQSGGMFNIIIVVIIIYSPNAIKTTTSGSAMAEGPRDALVSRNSATTKHPI